MTAVYFQTVDSSNPAQVSKAVVQVFGVLVEEEKTPLADFIPLKTRLPFEIADGERGEHYRLVEIKQKHFHSCKIAEGLAEHEQVIVLSHFKGHNFAGFGGAIKQLGMGFAAKGGKLDQHANSIPKINTVNVKPAVLVCGIVLPRRLR
jgi:uncharacterized Fe-S center protein